MLSDITHLQPKPRSEQAYIVKTNQQQHPTEKSKETSQPMFNNKASASEDRTSVWGLTDLTSVLVSSVRSMRVQLIT